MKHLLIAAMLVIMGQRWEDMESYPSLDRCVFDDPTGRTALCKPAEDLYRLVYVIGEQVSGSCNETWTICPPSAKERFTIPVPNTPTRAMTKAEAEKANKELSKE